MADDTSTDAEAEDAGGLELEEDLVRYATLIMQSPTMSDNALS